MKKVSNSNCAKGCAQKASKSLKEQRKSCYGYRPNGDRTSELSTPPNVGTSIQNAKNK